MHSLICHSVGTFCSAGHYLQFAIQLGRLDRQMCVSLHLSSSLALFCCSFFLFFNSFSIDLMGIDALIICHSDGAFCSADVTVSTILTASLGVLYGRALYSGAAGVLG